MPLLESKKRDIRRFLYYPVAGLYRTSTTGGSLASGSASYRFFQAWGTLENKMNNLSAGEEAALLGLAYASLAFTTGKDPATGDNIQLTFSGGGLGAPHTLSVTALAGDSLVVLAARIAAAGMLDTTLMAAGFQFTALYGTGPFTNVEIAVPEVSFTNAATFTVALAYTGTTAPSLENGSSELAGPSSIVDPSTSPPTVRTGFLPILKWLEGALIGTTQNQDTSAADVWKRNPFELRERKQSFQQMRRSLSDYLGIPFNPNKARSSNGPTMRV